MYIYIYSIHVIHSTLQKHGSRQVAAVGQVFECRQVGLEMKTPATFRRFFFGEKIRTKKDRHHENDLEECPIANIYVCFTSFLCEFLKLHQMSRSSVGQWLISQTFSLQDCPKMSQA